MEFNVISTEGVRDIAPSVLNGDGTLKLLGADFWSTTTVDERAIFGVKNSLYGFPTKELIAFINNHIDGRRAIEIGSGSGDLARELGIVATDNRMQEDPRVAALYRSFKQPPVRYGKHVETLAAADAIRKYAPRVVVANWVTHLYREDRHAAGGNMFGVDEEDILAHCEEYIFIGNEKVHAGKSIWNQPHSIIYPDWLYSRAMNGTRNFIAFFKGSVNAQQRLTMKA